MKPLAIDLFAGLGGWTEGLLAEGYYVVGFDIERHEYGDAKYPAQLVLQDVLTLHGRQFRDAALIVASPPCQEFSYMAMPWSMAKAIAAEYRSGVRDVKKLTALFDACFRIQREAIEAAGHFIPLVVENVRGANEWVGRSRWNFGSFHLWGDVPALMPMTKKVREGGQKTPDGNCSEIMWKDRPIARYAHATPEEMEAHGFKVPGFRFDGSGKSFQTASVEGTKTAGRSLSKDAPKKFGTHNMGSAEKIYAELGIDGHSHTRHLTNQAESDGVKQHKSGRAWFADTDSISGSTSSKSNARKAASAQIAKIPFALSSYIARTYKPGVAS